MNATAITAEYVRQILDYNPGTGEFTWKERTPDMFKQGSRRHADISCRSWNTRYAWKMAGRINNQGYAEIVVNYRFCQAHRLAWLYMTDKWPFADIDHIDGNRANNRYANLREATRPENLWNMGISPKNTSGFKGVSPHMGKWRATIMKNYRQTYLGDFDSIEEAAEAVRRERASLHGDFARVS